MLGKGKARKESATATVVVALSFLDTNRGDLLGSGNSHSCLTCVGI